MKVIDIFLLIFCLGFPRVEYARGDGEHPQHDAVLPEEEDEGETAHSPKSRKFPPSPPPRPLSRVGGETIQNNLHS